LGNISEESQNRLTSPKRLDLAE